MKRTKIFIMMLAVLIAVMGVWFTSCSADNKEPEPDYLFRLRKKWYATLQGPENYIEFKENGTYTCTLAAETLGGIYYNEMNINGMYSVREIEETTKVVGENNNYPALLFKMLASGSNDFDQLWIYHYTVPGDRHSEAISVHFYSGNEFVRERGFQGWL